MNVKIENLSKNNTIVFFSTHSLHRTHSLHTQSMCSMLTMCQKISKLYLIIVKRIKCISIENL